MPKSVIYVLVIIAISTLFSLFISNNTKNERLVSELDQLTSELESFITFSDGEAQIGFESESNWKADETLAVVRNTRYSVELRLDPILGFEGLDTESLRRAISEDAELLPELFFGGHDQPEAVVSGFNNVHSHLKYLPDLEEKRRLAIKYPTTDNITDYNNQLEQALNGFTEAIYGYRQALETFIADPNREMDYEGVVYHYPSGVTGITTLLMRLDQIESTLDTLKAKQQKRLACLNGQSTYCVPLESTWDKFSNSLTDTVNSDETGFTLSDELKNNLDFARSRAKITNTNIEESLAVLSSYECWADESVPTFFYVANALNKNAESNVLVTQVNDIFFLNLAQMTNRPQVPPVLRDLLNNNVRYSYQNIGNPYMCPDAGTPLARVLSLLSFRDLLSATPIFANTDQANLSSLENRIVADEVLSQVVFEHYLNEITSTLSGQTEEAVVESLGLETILKAETIVSAHKQQGIAFDSLVESSNSLNRLILDSTFEIFQPSTNYSLLHYPYLSIFFLLFHDSMQNQKTGTQFSLLTERSEVVEPWEKFGVSRRSELAHPYSVSDFYRDLEIMKELTSQEN